MQNSGITLTFQASCGNRDVAPVGSLVGSRGGLMVSALDYGTIGPCFES